jgi:hypothetical protein
VLVSVFDLETVTVTAVVKWVCDVQVVVVIVWLIEPASMIPWARKLFHVKTVNRYRTRTEAAITVSNYSEKYPVCVQVSLEYLIAVMSGYLRLAGSFAV